MADETRSNSPVDTVLAVWSRRKWLAILVFVAPLVAGVSLVVSLPNVYRSAATVLAERQQVPDFFVRATVTSALETRIQAISQDVLSRSRLGALIQRFGLYPEQQQRVPLERIVERMRKDIKLELKSMELKGLREATVSFTITYQGGDPDTVSRVANTLASFYNEENVKAREQQATGTTEFLKVQLGESKKRLDELEQRVSAFKRRHLGELPQQMDSNLGTLERLDTQLRQNADGQTRVNERRQMLSSQLAEAEESLAAGQAGGQFVSPELREAARLAQKKEELARLRIQFNDNYPDVVLLAAEVAALERELEAAKTRMPESTAEGKPTATPVTPYTLRLKESLGELQTELKILKTEEGRLRDAIAVYQARVDNVPRREQEFIELSRDYESTRQLYASLMKRYEEAQLAETMEQTQKGEQFRVVDPAMPIAEPAAPNRIRLLAMTLAGAIGLAIAVVLAAEQLDTSFHSLDELRAFSKAPVLVSIPRIVTPKDSRRRWWRMRLAATAAVVGLVMVAGVGYLAAHGNEDLVLLLAKVAS
jgi:polysaccharide chain length determinant protein (PEP-CTERM system associated)